VAHHAAAAGHRVAQRLQQRLGGRRLGVLPAEDAHQVRRRHPLQPVLDQQAEAGVGADQPGLLGATAKS
jgi:hypothetical protein